MAAADIVLYNGQVFTAEASQPRAQAIAVDDGRILQVGSDAAILALADASTQRIDLAGKVLMPGMIDTHSHPVMGALASLRANLYDEVKPLAELEQWILAQDAAGTARLDDIIAISGVSSAYWKDSRALAKRFNQGRWAEQPLVLDGIDGHTGWANQAMLRRVGIDAALIKTLDAKEASYIEHEADLTPTGYLSETGWDRVRSQLPKPSHELMLKAAREAVRLNLEVGVTAWMDAAANGGGEQSLFEMRPTTRDLGVLPLYRELAEKGELNVHVAALLLTHPQSKPEDLAVQAEVMRQFEGVPNLTFPGLKVFVDGILEYPGQTAAVIDPYTNSHKQGQLLIDPQGFGPLLVAAEQRGWIVHMHAVGDRAVRESLNAVQYARQHNAKALPHSITHLQLVNPKEFARFRELGVIASMQLLWATAESYTEELVKPYVSAFAYRYQYPARSLHKAGATIAGASDWPVSSPNPWNAIAQASTRTGPLGVLNAAESIDRETMLRAYTINAAKALRLEDRIGSLAPGKQADLIVLDRDIFTVSDAELFDTRVLQTWFAGKPVYQAGATIAHAE
ncbi:amidohydrolase [Aquipseudomonas alcaligenes]|nr:amidohydrolase [Pseudomonas alcaligenes]SUD14655.1 amidohydrolase family protein [Pseudomonas alcaligenes]